MKFLKPLYCFVYVGLVLGLGNSANAEILSVEYKSFYSHVKQLDKEEMDALQFAFGFLNIHTKNLCGVKEARISTEKKQIPLKVSEENRFTVPSERALNLAKALVIVELEQASNVCDMSVQLETKPEYLKRQYSQNDLIKLLTQYETFFDKMGGFLSFMMPSVTGITLVFPSSLEDQSLDNGLQIVEGNLFLNESAIESLNTLNLPVAPSRIIAVTKK